MRRRKSSEINILPKSRLNEIEKSLVGGLKLTEDDLKRIKNTKQETQKLKEDSETYCTCCKWYEAYDDGDGYWDVECNHPEVNIDNWGKDTFLYKDPLHCPFYEDYDDE